ncbi:3-hydroxybutyryl-CoA dehydrogenase [Uliginosibacterium flavum]|uniref:3-hydroxyacyl-CoA dehydrogenase NAD-binding domain-containing protein n=1 Tax=Uliginosibacterium flavum TaxID=1396831 RepID=A0ABV2TJM3_9RHOO
MLYLNLENKLSDNNKVVIVGAGTMGAGIAQVFSLSGYDVSLYATSERSKNGALASIRSSLERLCKKGIVEQGAAEGALSRVKFVNHWEAIAEAGVVIEAVPESIEVKKTVLEACDNYLRPDALVGTNTSSISITRLACFLSDPSRLVGLHFFNPAPLMSLVELVVGVHTSPTIKEGAVRLIEKVGKVPIVVQNSPGFVVNRMLCPMINEAFFILGQGVASAEEIDQGMKLGCNHPIGPLGLADLIGLDVLLSIMDVLLEQTGDSKYRAAPLLREFVDAGMLGRKVFRGVFSYEEASKTPIQRVAF